MCSVTALLFLFLKKLFWLHRVCVATFSSCGEWDCSVVEALRFLIVAVCLLGKHALANMGSQLGLTGFVALQRVGSPRTRDQTVLLAFIGGFRSPGALVKPTPLTAKLIFCKSFIQRGLTRFIRLWKKGRFLTSSATFPQTLFPPCS